MPEIQRDRAYLDLFPKEVRKRALELAHDFRKFEIELYWKRAAYFWTLIAASFAGYFSLQGKAENASRVFLVTCLGFLLSLAWYLVNRGSKYWQENWEYHVDQLEEEFVGPLYKTGIVPDGFWQLLGSYRYSVSRINQLISLFVLFVWLVLSIQAWDQVSRQESYTLWTLAGLTIFFAVLLLTLGRGGSADAGRGVNLIERELDLSRERGEADSGTSRRQSEDD